MWHTCKDILYNVLVAWSFCMEISMCRGMLYEFPNLFRVVPHEEIALDS